MIIKYMITLIFIIIIRLTRCSIVLEELTQKSSHISKYCHKERYCRKGTHVVCMYYDDNHVYGPRCGNPIKVEVTPKMIQKILANINDIRGEVATGMEKGKYAEVLPRAYGLMKLEWDKELAFFAQVLANQCLGGRGDLCRGTERFPNPSQTIAIVRYKYPDWEYLKPNSTEKGFNEEKLLFAVDTFFKYTHALKKSVTKNIIVNCPSIEELPDRNLRLYLNLIRGGATHIGCGASAFSSYKASGDGDSMQNNVQIVCNISDSPRSNQSVYKIVPPIPGQGYTKRCGCPIGYEETRTCLCKRDMKFNWKEQQIKNQLKDLRTKIKNNDEAKSARKPKLSVIHGSSEKRARQTNGIKSPHTISKSRNIIIIKGSNTNKNNPERNNENETSDEFSKITSAKPKNNARLTHESNSKVMIFSKPQNHNKVLRPAISANAFGDLIFKVRTYEGTSERGLDVVKENLVENYHTTKKTLRSKAQDKHHQFAHNKILSLLDSLEQEVKNLKFDDHLKQIFDWKMRKIYKTGVNRSQETTSARLALDKQLNKKDLHTLRRYLQTESNESIDDEIASLRKMVHGLSKGAQRDHKIGYAENEYDANHNYNYVDQQFDEYYGTKYVNDMDNSNEDISKHGDYHMKFNDILNSKHNVHHPHDQIHNIQDNTETRNQNTYVNNNERESFFSKAIQQGFYLDKQDDEKVELQQSTNNKIIKVQQEVEGNYKKNIDVDGRHLHKITNYESAGPGTGTISDRRQQLNNPFSRRNKNGEVRQILLRRLNQKDLLRTSINPSGQSIYPSERDTFMF